MNSQEIIYQLALSNVEGIGVKSARKLIRYFKSAEEVFQQGVKDLMQIPGMQITQAKSIHQFNNFSKEEKELNFIEKNNFKVYSFLEKDFPQRLLNCEDSPIVLFGKGNMELNPPRVLSIVGNRKITEYGAEICLQLIADLKAYDVTIVSGLAYGVDIQAHRAAIKHKMQTIGVLAHGLNRIYPDSHFRDVNEMVENGGVLTEFGTNSKPDRENFPKRNRIVAGMCDAVIVVESGARGGSIITAEIANSYSRDVFAIPGRIGDPQSEGCNNLIKTNRAALLQSAKDLEYIMGWQAEKIKKSVQTQIFVELGDEEQVMVDFLKAHGEIGIDLLCIQTKIPMSKAMVHLLNLELNGVIKSLPGKKYALN